MSIAPVVLWTDGFIFLLFLSVLIYIRIIIKHEHLKEPWRKVFTRPSAVVAVMILLFYVVIALIDSLHFQKNLSEESSQEATYSSQVSSMLDGLLPPLMLKQEKSYSSPLASRLYQKDQDPEGARLLHAPYYLNHGVDNVRMDVSLRIIMGIALGVIAWIGIAVALLSYLVMKYREPFGKIVREISNQHLDIPWRLILICLLFVCVAVTTLLSVADGHHLLGTDKVGQDILYQCLKSIRTGLLIGTLTTLFMLPFALAFGTIAGYFGGLFDDAIQYLYTVLSSIPAVLLIAATILSMQIYIGNHESSFPTIAARADARLLALCLILGITGWTNLCRIVRAETMKLREANFVQVAVGLDVDHLKIIWRHIVPNVMPLVMITLVIDFSSLVLAEAVLSYVGVGVDPTTISWGNMINSARLELTREPIVWWPLVSAFIFMLGLVLSANIFADAVRDAFDPRLEE